jgi:hypothetical protein
MCRATLCCNPDPLTLITLFRFAARRNVPATARERLGSRAKINASRRFLIGRDATPPRVAQFLHAKTGEIR